ncbi:hypothetical protein Mal33_53510 [Rosistilla oblonga]|uniref:Uncharacterized protein n=1 Tax=Rosistilla oblonga TaxID=2527990 RepID=A0A518J1W5_9BACT|nr:hypothetical protein Mal33_53510 [Rosistilla oblonga]
MTDPFPRKLPFIRGKPRQLVTEILSVVKHSKNISFV